MVDGEKEHYIFVPEFLRFNPEKFVGQYLKSVFVYPYSDIEKEWAAYKAEHPLGFFQYKNEIQDLVFEKYNYSRFDGLFSDADFTVFNDGSPFVSALMLKYPHRPFTLVEDGEAVYTSIKKDLRYLIKLISAYPMPFGQSKYINRLEVRFPERLSHKIRRKAAVLNYDKLITLLSQTQVDELMRFFEVQDLKLDAPSSLILLTQPLSEDGLVDEKYKVALYQKVIKEYLGERQLFVKPHPRETTDYNAIFSQSVVISKHSPVEVLEFLPYQFDRAITYFSTSIHAINAKEKVYLSLDYDDKVKQAWLKYMGVNKINK